MSLTGIERTVLASVQEHPGLMSPVLLEYVLRGEVIGRMAEKHLLSSRFHGALSGAQPLDIAKAIARMVEDGYLFRQSGFYPALHVSSAGEQVLLGLGDGSVTQVAPTRAYRAYYRWRQDIARRRRTPPYRVFPNNTVNALAKIRPMTLEELLLVPGLGKRRALRYQQELLEVGRRLADEMGLPAVLSVTGWKEG